MSDSRSQAHEASNVSERGPVASSRESQTSTSLSLGLTIAKEIILVHNLGPSVERRSHKLYQFTLVLLSIKTNFDSSLFHLLSFFFSLFSEFLQDNCSFLWSMCDHRLFRFTILFLLFFLKSMARKGIFQAKFGSLRLVYPTPRLMIGFMQWNSPLRSFPVLTDLIRLVRLPKLPQKPPEIFVILPW